MVRKCLKDCVIVTAGTGERDWTNQQLKTWVTEAGGSFERTLDDSTTHLVITKRFWDTAGLLTQEAITRKNNGQKLTIVSQDWLWESLQERIKKKEKAYTFSVPGSDHYRREEGGVPRSHTGLLKELYLENTELSPAQKKLNDKKQQMEEDVARERAAEKEMEFQKHMQSSMSMPELAAIFKKGAQKAQKVILSENFHIYQDPTGFHYDITLTKVDTARNTNERYNLVIQIFESNNTPSTYAMSTSFSGTKMPQTVNVVVAIGANLPTAMRSFRNCFKDKTGVDWADRVKVARERAVHEQEMKRAKKMGAYAREQLGLPVGPKTAEDFRFQKFLYYPPSYGPIGEVIDNPPPETGALNEPIILGDENMMSGGNGMKSRSPSVGAAAPGRSETPVQAVFGPQDLEKFNEAQTVEDEYGEKLDPVTAPFEYGQTALDEFASTVAEDAEGSVGATQYGGATQYMDPSSYRPAQVQDAEQTTPVQQIYANPTREPKHTTAQIVSESSVLGKRKDSPLGSSKGGKKQKVGPETGEYIIESSPAPNMDKETGGEKLGQ